VERGVGARQRRREGRRSEKEGKIFDGVMDKTQKKRGRKKKERAQHQPETKSPDSTSGIRGLNTPG